MPQIHYCELDHMTHWIDIMMLELYTAMSVLVKTPVPPKTTWKPGKYIIK